MQFSLYAQSPPTSYRNTIPNIEKKSNKIIDSLENLLKKPLNEQDKFATLKELCWRNRNADRLKAIEYGKQALAIAQRTKHRMGEADMWRFLGIVQWQHLYNQLALENFFKALEISEQLDYQEGIGYCYDNLSVAFTDQRKYEQALTYALQSAQVFEKINNLQGMGYAYMHLGVIYMHLHNYEKALAIQQKGLKVRELQKDTTLINNTLREIGQIYKLQKQYKEAEFYLQQALALALKVGNDFATAETQQHLAEVYLAQNQIDKALETAQTSFAIAEKYHNLKQLIYNANVLSKIYEAQKNYPQALHYIRVSQTHQDSLLNEEIRMKLIEKSMQHDFHKKEQEFLVEQAKDEEKDRQQNLIIGLLAVLGVVGSSLLFVIYKRHKESVAMNEDLQQKNEEIMQMAEELQAQAESLQISNEFKDQLFSIIGHDLRSPLVGVNGIFELRNEGLLDDEEFLAVLPDVSQNIYQVTVLTENLLFWAKSQIKGQFLRLEVLDLHSFANNQVDLFRTQTLSKNVLLTNQVPFKMMVLADSNMLDLVLRNLVGNAVKFTKDTDIITIKAEKIDADTIQVCVEDTGVGMSKESVDKLFGNFVFTLRGTSNEKGTGLGLRLCKEFVEKNGGKIWVTSELGKGSKFYFTLKVSF